MHYHPGKWLHLLQINFLLMEKENDPRFQCIDTWNNDCHLANFSKWHIATFYDWLGKFICFLYMFYLNDTRQKFQHHRLGQCKFLIYQRISLLSKSPHNMIISLWPTLTSFSSLYMVVLDFVYLFLYEIEFNLNEIGFEFRIFLLLNRLPYQNNNNYYNNNQGVLATRIPLTLSLSLSLSLYLPLSTTW